MARFTLSLLAAGLVATAAWSQTDETPADESTDPAPVVGQLADADGDGIPNHADEDFERPDWSRGKGPKEFVDADGDGINDLAPDADGDGVPNYLDEDYERTPVGTAAGRGARQGARGFVDEDGDGINDLAPDADGDGVPNHLDADYERTPMANGSGQGAARGRRGVANGPGTFVDADGDGVNDLAPDTDGDGVINHLDEDYERPGTGRGASGAAQGGQGRGASQSAQGSGRGAGRR